MRIRECAYTLPFNFFGYNEKNDRDTRRKVLGLDEYKLLLKIIEKLDRFVDISNATGMSKRGINKGYKCIDSPEHEHL